MTITQLQVGKFCKVNSYSLDDHIFMAGENVVILSKSIVTAEVMTEDGRRDTLHIYSLDTLN